MIVQDSEGQERKFTYGILIKVGDALKPREIQALQYAADGLSIDQAAEKAGIASRSIETYRGRAMAKLGANSMAHAVAMAFRQGVLIIEEGGENGVDEN